MSIRMIRLRRKDGNKWMCFGSIRRWKLPMKRMKVVKLFKQRMGGYYPTRSVRRKAPLRIQRIKGCW